MLLILKNLGMCNKDASSSESRIGTDFWIALILPGQIFIAICVIL